MEALPHRFSGCSSSELVNDMPTDKIYINWKEPDKPVRYSRDPPTVRQRDHENWTLAGASSTFDRGLFAHRTRLPGTSDLPHRTSNLYSNLDEDISTSGRRHSIADDSDITFVNSLFDDSESVSVPRPAPKHVDMSSQGSLFQYPRDQMYYLQHPTSRPLPCKPRMAFPEVVESPPPSRPRRTVHSQYISLEKAKAMESKPFFPPKKRSDTFVRNLSIDETGSKEKRYDLKVCLPDHFDTDLVCPESNIYFPPHELMYMKEGQDGSDPEVCTCRRSRSKTRTWSKGSKGHRSDEGLYSEVSIPHPASLAWDYADLNHTPQFRRKASRRRSERSPKGFQSYLADGEKASMFTMFTSTECLAPSSPPEDATSFDDQILPSVPCTNIRDIRRSISDSSIPTLTRVRQNQYDGVSLDLENNIEHGRKVFQRFRHYGRIRSQLKNIGHIILTGYPGIGKTALAYQLIRDIASGGAQAIVVDSPDSFPKKIHRGPVILLIDDMFGSCTFDEPNIETWKKVLTKIEDIKEVRAKESTRHLTFFFIVTTRLYVLKEALPFLGKYVGTIFSEENILDLGAVDLTDVDKMSVLTSHAKEKGKGLDPEVKVQVVNCKTYAFPQLCQLYFAGTQMQSASHFFEEPMKYLVPTFETLFFSDRRKFACMVLMALSDGKLNMVSLENDNNADDDLKTKMSLVMKYGEVKDPKPTTIEMGKDLKLLIGTFISVDGDYASFLHPSMYDAVMYLVGERNPEIIFEHCSMRFIFDRVRISSVSNGSLTRTHGNRRSFHLFLSPTYFTALSKRFKKEITAGSFALVCSHDVCSTACFTETIFSNLKEKGLVSRSPSTRLHGKCSVHSSDKDHGGKFLYWTTWNKSHELCKIFLDRCSFTKKEKSQAMIGCALSGNVKAMALLLEHIGADSVFYEPGSTMPCLMPQPRRASFSQVTQTLILGSTPLHIASERGQLGIVKLLLIKGADVNKAGPRVAATPLHYACQGGFTQVAAQLLNAGANVNSLDWVMRTPLHWAAAKGHTELVEFLTFNHADLDAPDDEGLTPLHCAAWGGYLDTCVSLLNAGASPKARTRYDQTPLDISIDDSFKKRFHDTIVFDFNVFVDETCLASWLVGLRGPLILSISSTSIMVKRPRNHEILFEWSLKMIRRLGNSPTAFKFEAGRHCDTGQGIYNFLTADAIEILRCIKMRLCFLQQNNDMLFHRRAPPLH